MRRALVIAFVAACSDDEVDPITKITAPRVLAVTTEPSVLTADGSITLRPVVVDPSGPREPDALRMRACDPWRLVADPARDCVDERAVVLDVAEGKATLSAAVLAAAFPPPAASARWPAALPVTVILEADVDGSTLVARREIAVVDAEVTRTNPRIAEVRFDGRPLMALESGRPYELAVVLDPDALDEDPDQPGAREPATVTVYSPAGELADHSLDVEPETAASAPTTYTTGAPGPTWLFVVVTDATAGMSTVALPLTVD